MISSRPATNEVVEALNAAVPTLDPAEQGLVIELYRAMMTGKPVAVADLAARVGWEVSQVEDALGRWPGVYRAKDGRIIGFWGLAVRGMPHRLSSDAGHLTTWCALDPLLIAPLVTDEAHVESADPVSGARISLTVTPAGLREVNPATTAVSMLLPKGPFSHDVVESFCHFVHFFASKQTGQRWIAMHPGTFLLSAEEAFEVARRSWPALFEATVRPSQGRYSTTTPKRP